MPSDVRLWESNVSPPTSPTLLAAIGRVATEWSTWEATLDASIRTLLQLPEFLATDVVQWWDSKSKAAVLMDLSRFHLGEVDLISLTGELKGAATLGGIRNDVVHSAWLLHADDFGLGHRPRPRKKARTFRYTTEFLEETADKIAGARKRVWRLFRDRTPLPYDA